MALRLATLLILAFAPIFAQAAEVEEGRCRALLDSAIRKPYGWAWEAREGAGVLPRGGHWIDLQRTPARALELYEAGRALKRPEYIEAARQAARGILAAQEPSGRIPALASFAATASPRDPASVLPDRRPTCAALGLLLTLIEHGDADETMRRGASRAALWLMRQQTPTGMWPTLFENRDGSTTRLVRLDLPDWRDCTLALLYSARILNNNALRTAAERSTHQLARLALNGSDSARGLWMTAYELTGAPSERLPHHAGAADMLATQHALETLVAARLLAGDKAAFEAAQASAATLAALRGQDNKWRRLYQLRNNEVETRPPADGQSPFAPDPGDVAAQLLQRGDFGLPPVLDAIALIAQGKGAGCLTARTLVGLSDEPLRQGE